MTTPQLALVAAFGVLLCTGCARDIGRAAQKHGIRLIQIEPRVNLYRPLRFGYDANSGEISAQIVSTIDSAIHNERMRVIGSLMASNEIRLPALIRERATARLRELPHIEITTNAPDGIFVVSIEQYGFDGLGFRNARYIPFIVLEGELVGRNGKRVWARRAKAHPIWDDHVSARFEKYISQPELLRAHWQHQVDLALKRLLKGIDVTTLLLASATPGEECE